MAGRTRSQEQALRDLRGAVGEIRDFIDPLFENRFRKLAVAILVLYFLITVVTPFLSPPLYGPYETVYANDAPLILAEPSTAAPLGTTAFGYSILSQTLFAFKTSMMVGVATALIVVTIGMNLGLLAGYFGGKIDSALMAMTDFVYGLPIYPFAIVIMIVLGRGTLNIALVIGLLLWRTIARVTRSETLTLKERTFVKSAKASGTRDLKIIYSHILPNLLPLVVVYFMFGTIWGILLEAGLSFLGLGDPNTISWGIMLHAAFQSGNFSFAWWWILPPAFSLWLFIWALYVVARALEENVETDVSFSR